MIMVDGMILQEVRLGGRSALQILGPGDVVMPDGAASDALDVRIRWTAAVDSRVAVLDDRLQAPFRLWPGLALALVERTGQQLGRAAVHAAIAQLPRVDQRLEATFWQLADRWGHVTPSGIHIPLALTHEVLAQLVGGRRPTITLALADLAERGVLVRHPDRTWLLPAHSPSLPANGPTEEPPVLEPRLTQPHPPWRTIATSQDTDVLDLRTARENQRRELETELARARAICERSKELHEAILRRRARTATSDRPGPAISPRPGSPPSAR
jgi:CRP-like cAMP-binding protein